MPFGFFIKRIVQMTIGITFCIVLSNCAFGTARISLTHDPLPNPPAKRQGSVVLERFTDERPSDQGGEYIGNKRNGYGMVLGHVGLDSAKIDSVLTRYIGEALKNTGYTVIYGSAKTATAADATAAPIIMKGKIKKCWMDMYMVANAQIAIDLFTPNNNVPVWKSNITGEKINLLWWGVKSEFANVYKEALNFALDSAQQKFSSEEFARKVNTR
jgi:hypothetical protein